MTISAEHLSELEAELRDLLKGQYTSLTLSFNEIQSPNYMTARQFLDQFGEDNWCGDWPSDEEKECALEANSVWQLHWYPQTPIGFHAICAASLPALFDAVRAEFPPHEAKG